MSHWFKNDVFDVHLLVLKHEARERRTFWLRGLGVVVGII